MRSSAGYVLPQGHLARLVVELIEHLDSSELLERYAGTRGVAFDPAMLLGLLIYCCATGVFASREIERACRDSIAVRFISANMQPGHYAIADFRRRCMPQIESLFVRMLVLARKMGVTRFGTIALHDTREDAQASERQATRRGDDDTIEPSLHAEVSSLLGLSEQADDVGVRVDVEMPTALARRELRIKAIDAAQAQFQRSAQGRDAAEQRRHGAVLALSRSWLSPVQSLAGRVGCTTRTGFLLVGVFGLAVVLGAAAQAYLLPGDHTSAREDDLLHYAWPFALVGLAGALAWCIAGARAQGADLGRKLEQRVLERTHELQTTIEANTRLLATASHDLRQPAVTIGLLVGLLREKIADPALRIMTQRVDEAVASMERLLSGVLDLSRLDSGARHPRLQVVPLQPMFDAIAVHEVEVARRKGLELRMRATQLAVWSDPLLLEQILRNFVSNALRYTKAGGVLLAARRGSAGKLRLQVWDTGPGIDISHQPVAFDPSAPIDHPRRGRRVSAGLGLAIVRHSAAVLGAPVALASRPGRGSCFEVSVPLAGTHDASVPTLGALESLPAGALIVLVHDDAAVREALHERLIAWNAQVLAFDGPCALRAALDTQRLHFRRTKLVIATQRLACGSGFDVIELMRHRFGPVPALVIASGVAPRDIDRLKDVNVRVLPEPFRTDELLACLTALLKR